MLLSTRCRRCSEVFANRHDLYLHGVRQHYNQTAGALQPRPWRHNEVSPLDSDAALRKVYEANAPIILGHCREGPIQSIYNYPITNNVDVDQLMEFARDICRREQRAFRLNLRFGVILQNRETGQNRCFIRYTKIGVFDRPVYISKRGDLLRLR